MLPAHESCAVKIDYIRDGLVEEFHNGYLQCFDKANPDQLYYIRSCAKPLQASLLIDYGIDFSPEEIAFCSGSHAGEDCHEQIAKRIINKLNISEKDLKCGTHPPLSRTMQDKMLLEGKNFSEIHNNCSGKHLGFLAICKKNNWDISSYFEPNHPLQIKVKNKIYELCEIHPSKNYPITTDGCGVPIVSMPLYNLLVGYKNLAKYYPQIVDSILKYPYIYGGENRLDTEIIQKSDNILAKVGAGGLCVVFNKNINDCFAVKIYDAANQARRIAVLEILKRFEWANIEYDSAIKTLSGQVVGNVTVSRYLANEQYGTI